MSRMVRVLIVDDHDMVAESFRRVLEAEHDLTVVGVAANAAQAVELAQSAEPDVVLMDYVLPDGDGVSTAAQIKALCPNVRTILITGAVAPEALPAALTAGCVGYLEKTGPLDRLAAAIRDAAAGGLVMTVENLSRALNVPAPAPDLLTRREREIIEMLARGLSTRKIADEASVSAGTVNAHVARILSKLNVHSRLEAVAVARQRGLIDGP